VYVVLTVVLAVLFAFGGMSVVRCVNHALTTMPTGGFSTRNDPLGAFSPFIQWVTILFMFLAGTSFTLHYRALRGIDPRTCVRYRMATLRRHHRGRTLDRLHDPLAGHFPGGDVRTAMFQVVSIVTTTGYGTADFVLWAPGAQVALFLLFFLGGMAGSTAGGMKMIRVLLVLKQTWIEIRKQLHPRAVFVPKVAGRPVRDYIMLNVLGFVLIYMLLFGSARSRWRGWACHCPPPPVPRPRRSAMSVRPWRSWGRRRTSAASCGRGT
jgi:trk system potassium uptake protein